MKYLYQATILFAFTMLGELLHAVLPFPIPAAIYGLVLLFLALCFGIVKPEQVKTAGAFLTGIMSVLFVSPAVGLVSNWELIRPQLLPICLLILASTVITFGISGSVTQLLQRKGGASHD